MPAHECETYDFPVKKGKLEYRTTKTYQPGGGVAAVREAIQEAKDKAEREGEAAMRKETCEPPCKKAVFVDTTILSIEYPRHVKGNIVIEIKGEWQAGILCFKAAG